MNSEEQQQRIMGYFIEEAREHLQTIEEGVLNLQEILDDPESINEVFRAAHSIKGGSAMLGVGSIQHISHRLEDFFKILKENPQVKVDERLKSLLLAGFDPLTELLDELQVGFKISDELTYETNTRVKPIFAELESYLNQLLAEGDEQVEIATARQKLEIAQKPTEPVVAAEDTLEVIFQREVTTKMRDMLQVFRGEDSMASRSQLQDICNYFQKVGNDFSLPNWTNLAVQSKNAIVQPANSYRTLAPIVIREIKEAQDLVLANREAEITISVQLQNLLPYRFGADEDDEISTLFTTAPNVVPDLNIATRDLEDAKLTEAEPSVALAVDDFESVTNGEDPDQIDLFADTDNESFDLGAIDDSAIDQMDWMDSAYEISEDQTIDGPKIGATELKSLAILFENDDIDFDSAWEDIESNESNIANRGSDLSASDRDEFADLLESDSTFNESGNFHNSEEDATSVDQLFGDFPKDDESPIAKYATATQDLFPEDTEISWKIEDAATAESEQQEFFGEDIDLGIDIIDQLDQEHQPIPSDAVYESLDVDLEADTQDNFLDGLDERSPLAQEFAAEVDFGEGLDESFGDEFTDNFDDIGLDDFAAIATADVNPPSDLAIDTDELITDELSNGELNTDDPFASPFTDLEDPFAIDESLDADLLGDLNENESNAIATDFEPSTSSELINGSDDFDTTDTSNLRIFDELGFDDDHTASNHSNLETEETLDQWNELDQLQLDQSSGLDDIEIGDLSRDLDDDFDSGVYLDAIATKPDPQLDQNIDSNIAATDEGDNSFDSFLDSFDQQEEAIASDDLAVDFSADFSDNAPLAANVTDDDQEFADFFTEIDADSGTISTSISAPVSVDTPKVLEDLGDFFTGEEEVVEQIETDTRDDDDFASVVEDVSWDDFNNDLNSLDELEGLDSGMDQPMFAEQEVAAITDTFDPDFDNDLEGDLDSFLNLDKPDDLDLANNADIATDFDHFGDFDALTDNDEERSLTQNSLDDSLEAQNSAQSIEQNLQDIQNIQIEQIDQSIVITDEFADEFADLAADLGNTNDGDIDANTTTNTTIDNLVDFFQNDDDESEMSAIEASNIDNGDADHHNQNLDQNFHELSSEFDAIAADFDDFDNLGLAENLPENLSNAATPAQTTSPTIAMPTQPQEMTGIDDDFDFDDLEAMLGDTGSESQDFGGFNVPEQSDDQTFIQHPATVTPQPSPNISTEANSDFDDLEALLGDTGGNDSGMSNAGAPSVKVDNAPSPTSFQDDFGDLEDMLQSAFAKDVGPIKTKPTNRPAVSPRKQRIADSTMRVDVKYLDSLNNLVGELVVNRNLLEQEQERLQQFITNLLHQVQLLSDVSQRMRDQSDRSLLEASLTAGRGGRSSSIFESAAYGGNEDANGNAVTSDFEGIEFDRYNTFHVLSQEIIELIVRVRESASDIEFVVGETDQVTRQLGTITTQIQDDLKQSRMVPFAQIADRLPRGIRDRALKTGKQAELEIYGRETLIDKAILESLTDPLTHLVNNAIDHGLEDPATRQAGGKSPMGKLTVRAYHQGNQTVISIGDDGAGISVDKVKKSAVAKRVRSQSEVDLLNDNEVYALLFEPGFSTAAQADEFKGRGVGLDVVKTCLDEIRGVIIVESAVGKGTSFTIRLPLTLSISKAMFCISDRARIAFPVDGFEDMVEVPQGQIVLNEKGQPCLPWRDTVLPFQHLSNLLAYNRHISRSNIYGKQENDELCIIILRNDTNYLALQVDQFLGESEIVIKQLEGPIPQPAGIAGATVLGDGRVMAIANVLELFDIASGRLRPSSSSIPLQPIVEEDVAADPTVLIVDDSITVRELLSLTFAKVGYRVEQAKDGQDAWEKLRAGLPCDMIFCDIEMPRMDGLDLLSRLQKDSRLKDIPVAMLTSRGADRHRQSAIQLGAKGYFTKPYLEEELLSASKRLLNGETLPI